MSGGDLLDHFLVASALHGSGVHRDYSLAGGALRPQALLALRE